MLVQTGTKEGHADAEKDRGINGDSPSSAGLLQVLLMLAVLDKATK